MGTVRGKRRVERDDLPKDLHDYVSKHLPNDQEDKIIKFIYDMRYARTSDICEYLGLSLSQTRKYLLNLYKRCYLYRKFRPVNRGSSEGYYYLDKASVFYLASNAGMTLREFGWDSRYNISDPDRMTHTLDITSIRVVFEKKCKDKSVVLEKFYGEKRVGLRKVSEEKSINPDGEFSLIVSDMKGKYLKKYFIEYDRGTEDLLKIKEKILKYNLYYDSEDCKDRYDIFPPELIFICNGEVSEKRVRSALAKNEKIFKSTQVFIAQFDSVLEEPLGETYENLNKNCISTLTLI